jgi:hypothetical protein
VPAVVIRIVRSQCRSDWLFSLFYHKQLRWILLTGRAVLQQVFETLCPDLLSVPVLHIISPLQGKYGTRVGIAQSL